MKKNYILLSAILLIGSMSFAQTRKELKMNINPEDIQYNSEVPIYVTDGWEKKAKRPNYNNKAFGDTLAYFDFGDTASGFRVINANQNNFVWKWDTEYDRGARTGAIVPIKSTTAANGFMSLPADFYNSPNITDQMDTYFVSDMVTITPKKSINVRYQHYLAICCLFASEIRFEVSTDSATWESYDMLQTLPIGFTNSDTANAVGFEELDLSPSLANVDTFWFRIRSTMNTLWWWMIDDIAFVEGPAQNLILTQAIPEFHFNDYGITAFYGNVPFDFFPPIQFSGNIRNGGGDTNTNVNLTVNVFQLDGTNEIHRDTTVLIYPSFAPISDSNRVTPVTDPFSPTGLHNYRAEFKISGDSVDQVAGNDSALAFFSVSDTTYARDDGGIGGGFGPNSIGLAGVSAAQIDGDRFASLYIVDLQGGNGGVRSTPTSITYVLSTNPRNEGVQIVPNIWPFDETDSTLNAAVGTPVATSFIPYTVQAADLGNAITLPLTSGSAVTSGNGLADGQYYVGWQVAGGTINPADTSTTRTFEVQTDNSAGNLQRSTLTTIMSHANNPGVGWFASSDRTNAAVRLNFGRDPILVGVDEKELPEVDFSIAPNPNNGEFRVILNSNYAVSYNLTVRNLLGQEAHSETISANGVKTKQLNLSHLGKGVYFVSLENQNERLVKKIIIK